MQLITLDRPQPLDALNSTLLGKGDQALDVFEADLKIGYIVITRLGEWPLLQADIKEMVSLPSLPSHSMFDLIAGWEKVSARRKAPGRSFIRHGPSFLSRTIVTPRRP
jgi:enoyl-CoA hydratase